MKTTSTLRLILVRNVAFYSMLSSLLILETTSKAAHLGGAVVLIGSIFLLLRTFLQLGQQGVLISRSGERFALVLNLFYHSLVTCYALFLAVKRQGVEYWLQLGVLLLGALILLAAQRGKKGRKGRGERVSMGLH